jgi:glycyl-tRNA synthetase
VNPEDHNDKYLPYIIETSVGADRSTLAILCDAYRDDKANERIVLKFHPKVAPVKVAVFPLSKKPELEGPSRKVFETLSRTYKVQYDDSGSIGKRYRRQEEIGTPFCITVDFETPNDQSVTIRHRDTMKQERIAIAQVENYIRDAFANWKMDYT